MATAVQVQGPGDFDKTDAPVQLRNPWALDMARVSSGALFLIGAHSRPMPPNLCTSSALSNPRPDILAMGMGVPARCGRQVQA